MASVFTDVNVIWDPNPKDHDEQLKYSSFGEFVGRMQDPQELGYIKDAFEYLIYEEYFTNTSSVNE